jgi:tRNA(Ile)-lysidine synthetase-like protein
MKTDPIILNSHPYVKALAAALKQRCGVRPGDRLLAAVSGGADSVALLRGLAFLAPRRRWQLAITVGHVQHRLRAEAEQDARFVAGLAEQLGLPFLRADLDLSTASKNLESAARKARYQALAIMAGQSGSPCIVTGHHGDDQLETLLMRILRGTSVQGLACMAWRRRLSPKPTPNTALRTSALQNDLMLIRPMLAVNRATVHRFLQALGQPWCEDRTNADLSRLRARLREQVLPVLRSIKADAPQRAVMLTDHLRGVAKALDQEIDSARQRVFPRDNQPVFPRAEARRWPSVVLIGLLRRLLIESGVGADRLSTVKLAAIARAIQDRTGTTRSFDAGGNIRVLVDKTTVGISTIH